MNEIFGRPLRLHSHIIVSKCCLYIDYAHFIRDVHLRKYKEKFLLFSLSVLSSLAFSILSLYCLIFFSFITRVINKLKILEMEPKRREIKLEKVHREKLSHSNFSMSSYDTSLDIYRRNMTLFDSGN